MASFGFRGRGRSRGYQIRGNIRRGGFRAGLNEDYADGGLGGGYGRGFDDERRIPMRGRGFVYQSSNIPWQLDNRKRRTNFEQQFGRVDAYDDNWDNPIGFDGEAQRRNERYGGDYQGGFNQLLPQQEFYGNQGRFPNAGKRGRFHSEMHAGLPKKDPLDRPIRLNFYDNYESANTMYGSQTYSQGDDGMRRRPLQNVAASTSRVTKPGMPQGGAKKMPRLHSEMHAGLPKKDPFSINFYDNYESANTMYGSQIYSQGDDGMRRRPLQNVAASTSRVSKPGMPRGGAKKTPRLQPERTEGEKAMYLKHKEIMLEKGKRDCINDSLDVVLACLKLVAQQLSDESGDYPQVKVAITANNADATTTHCKVNIGEKLAESTVTVKTEICRAPTSQDSVPVSKLQVEEDARKKPVQVLLGAIRCGKAAMRILIGADLQEIIVILSKRKPTRTLLERIKILLNKFLKMNDKMKNEEVSFTINDEKESIVLKQASISEFSILIRLTSPTCSSDNVVDENLIEPQDLLSTSNCLEALSQIRRMRFFFKTLDSCTSALTVVRILLSFRSVPSWSKLSDWLVLVLVKAAVDACKQTQGASKEQTDAVNTADNIFLMCLEILSSGIFLPTSFGLKDPCETDVDACGYLALQEAEDVTSAAQSMQRLIKCKDFHTAFGFTPEK